MTQGQPKGARPSRTVARLAAVQALYQMEVAGVGVEAVVREFSDHRFGGAVDAEDRSPGDDQWAQVDEAFFGDIVRGVVQNQSAIDQAVAKRLAANWRLERLDATLRATLRSATFELMCRKDVPTEVVLNEYVELAKAFFDKSDLGFVNGALDAVAGDLRG
jgi:N utilization substance protein B